MILSSYIIPWIALFLLFVYKPLFTLMLIIIVIFITIILKVKNMCFFFQICFTNFLSWGFYSIIIFYLIITQIIEVSILILIILCVLLRGQRWVKVLLCWFNWLPIFAFITLFVTDCIVVVVAFTLEFLWWLLNVCSLHSLPKSQLNLLFFLGIWLF